MCSSSPTPQHFQGTLMHKNVELLIEQIELNKYFLLLFITQNCGNASVFGFLYWQPFFTLLVWFD